MRFSPDSTRRSPARNSLANLVLSHGRYVAGTVGVLGALAVFGFGGGTADAATTHTKTKATPAATNTVNSAISYTIKNGDTLSAIALRNKLSVPSLATINGISNHDRITAGQKLLIPVNGASVSSTQQQAAKVTAKTVGVPKTVTATTKPSPGQPLPAELQKSSVRKTLVPSFKQAAATYGVRAELLESMMYQESGWNNTLKSSTGAIGVGQLMPDTITFVNQFLVKKPLDPKVPAQNIQMSAAFLRYLLNQTNGDERLALASYYQGLGSVQRIGWYDDTKVYVQSVLSIQARYF